MTVNEVRERIIKGECLSDMFKFTDGQDCMIYKGDWNPGDEVIYIPDIDLNNICIYNSFINSLMRNKIDEVLNYCYTGKDFMELCDNNEELAKDLFYYVDWQHPSSAIEIMKIKKNYILKDSNKKNYSIVKKRDDCSNAEWMYLCDLFELDYNLTEKIEFDTVVKFISEREGNII